MKIRSSLPILTQAGKYFAYSRVVAPPASAVGAVCACCACTSPHALLRCVPLRLRVLGVRQQSKAALFAPEAAGTAEGVSESTLATEQTADGALAVWPVQAAGGGFGGVMFQVTGDTRLQESQFGVVA